MTGLLRADLTPHVLSAVAAFAPALLDAVKRGDVVPHHLAAPSPLWAPTPPAGSAARLDGLAAGGDVYIPTPEEFVPPSAVRLFRFGDNPTTKGNFILEPGAGEVMKYALAYGNPLPFDYCHAMVAPPPGCPPDEAGKAAGWFRCEVRDDGLYAGRASWTPAGRERLRVREFAFTSPAFLATKKGEVVAIINCAITNIPATYDLTPLVSDRISLSYDVAPPTAADPSPAPPKGSEEPPVMKELLALLSLGPDASDAAAVIALNALKTAADARVAEANRATEAARAETRQVLDAVGAATLPAALGTISGLKDAAEKGRLASEALAKRAEDDKTAAKLAADASVKALLDAAERGDAKGVKLTPAGRKAYEAQALALGPEGVKAYLDAKGYELPGAPDQPAAGAAGSPGPAGQAGAPPKLLSKWEDYDAQPGGWRELERLGKESPAEFKRLHDDYQARQRAARGLTA
jgi:phage I-like protein